jgi:lysophospholipase L1-like esterase
MKKTALLFACCLTAAAQNPGVQNQSPVLAGRDLLTLESRVTELMEAAALAVPGLATAGNPIRQAAEATIAAQRAGAAASLNYRFVSQTRAWLAIADAFPRPVPFPQIATQQFTEIRQAYDRLQLSFEASLTVIEQQQRAQNADPNQLKRYVNDNLTLPPPAGGTSRVVFYGDSITDFWRLNEYFTGKDFINRGISGQTTTQMLARFRQDVIALQPKVVVILAGTNDIARGIPAKAIEDNLFEMGELAKANNIRVVIASLTPVSDYHKDVDPAYARLAARPPATIKEINDWIRQLCGKESFPYVNYYSAMVDPQGQMQADMSDDGLHPNAKGYRAMSPLVVDAINLALYDVPAAPTQKKRFGIVPPH